MNEDGTPISGNEEQEQHSKSAITREGAVAEASAEDVQSMYDDLGIKASAPTGSTKGRSKSSDVRNKESEQEDDDSADSGKEKASGSKGKSRAKNPTGKDVPTGSDNRKEESEELDKNGKVSGESDEAGEDVRKAESKSDKDSERGGKEGSDRGLDGDGQEDDDKGGAQEEEESGKRPGKSDPRVERRFQKLANDAREKDEQLTQQAQRIEALERQIRESTQRQEQADIDREDPEYTLDDFRGDVKDSEGNVTRLTEEQSELAYRRWKDGYDQRKAERDAKSSFDRSLEETQQEYRQKQIQESADAYDTLMSIADNYPALDANSEEYDKELNDAVMPLIEDMVLYEKGTEPGNEEGLRPVIVGLAMNPTKMLDVIAKLRNAKRDLPLNGTHDNVEPRSNVRVTHSRSSDPTINAANDLYEELGIKKRL